MNNQTFDVVVSDAFRRYGHVEALAGISLSVGRGEIFGILGPNGAGKTTLIRTLVGSSRPNAGTVQVLGLDPYRQARTLRQQIGYMPQAPALYEDLSARDNLRFFGCAHDRPFLDRRVDQTLDLVGLTARARDAVYALSGGMKQRVSLACALVHEPRVLLLDEPTAGVDPALREAFWQHFRRLAAGGVTILVSTHQMDEALLCDRLAILRGGKMLVCETPNALLARGRSRVRLWRGDTMLERTLERSGETLPDFLRAFGLDCAVTRIDIEPESLDAIVLGLIGSGATEPASEDRVCGRD